MIYCPAAARLPAQQLRASFSAAMPASTSEDRLAFLRFLAENFTPEPEALRVAAQSYLAEPNPDSAMRLLKFAEPPRQELIRRMNMGPGGTAASRSDAPGTARSPA